MIKNKDYIYKLRGNRYFKKPILALHSWHRIWTENSLSLNQILKKFLAFDKRLIKTLKKLKWISLIVWFVEIKFKLKNKIHFNQN
jgi:G:T-mismatch repair DNA endonuclease (very short patch repair protein)